MVQAEADITSTGVATITGTWDPPAAADRYGLQLMTGHGGMHNTAAETLTIRGNNANAIYDIPDAPPDGAPDEEWAASQTQGQKTPIFKKPGVNNYRISIREALVKAGWFPPGG